MHNRVLTPYEWMVRCLLGHFKVESPVEVFIVSHRRQNMSEGAEAARLDYRNYEENGYLPPYVVAEFYEAFPWNKEKPESELLAAE